MPTFSFELYPPRSGPAELELYRNLEHLIAAGPEFISVTYGANGSTRGRSLRILRHLLASTNVPPMAHLTCVGTSYSESAATIRDFLEAGITSFLALRGDPPEGSAEESDFLGDIRSASELVQLIHSIQAERVPFTEQGIPGFPGAARISVRKKVTIAVAAFPNGHNSSRSPQQDIDALLAKQAAGANLAITQLFFRADDFLGFVESARSAGVTMRILPGIMPVMSLKSLERVLELSGEKTPADLHRALSAAESHEDQQRIGLKHAVGLCSELLRNGSSGLHLYTLNRHEAALGVLNGLGLLANSTHPNKKVPA